jgi:hypothetical protein
LPDCWWYRCQDIYRYGQLETPAHQTAQKRLSVIDSVIFVWIIPSMDIFTWFAHELNEMFVRSEGQLEFPSLTIWIYVTNSKQSQPTLDSPNMAQSQSQSAASESTSLQSLAPNIPKTQFQFGRPPFDQILSVSQQFNQDAAHLVFTCGPTPMINQVWDAANRLKRQGGAFEFHKETFDW